MCMSVWATQNNPVTGTNCKCCIEVFKHKAGGREGGGGGGGEERKLWQQQKITRTQNTKTAGRALWGAPHWPPWLPGVFASGRPCRTGNCRDWDGRNAACKFPSSCLSIPSGSGSWHRSQLESSNSEADKPVSEYSTVLGNSQHQSFWVSHSSGKKRWKMQGPQWFRDAAKLCQAPMKTSMWYVCMAMVQCAHSVHTYIERHQSHRFLSGENPMTHL